MILVFTSNVASFFHINLAVMLLKCNEIMFLVIDISIQNLKFNEAETEIPSSTLSFEVEKGSKTVEI